MTSQPARQTAFQSSLLFKVVAFLKAGGLRVQQEFAHSLVSAFCYFVEQHKPVCRSVSGAVNMAADGRSGC